MQGAHAQSTRVACPLGNRFCQLQPRFSFASSVVGNKASICADLAFWQHRAQQQQLGLAWVLVVMGATAGGGNSRAESPWLVFKQPQCSRNAGTAAHQGFRVVSVLCADSRAAAPTTCRQQGSCSHYMQAWQVPMAGTQAHISAVANCNSSS
jgi:hypothetical protein